MGRIIKIFSSFIHPVRVITAIMIHNDRLFSRNRGGYPRENKKTHSHYS